MEENKKKKKLNKKPLLICLAIALVFAVIGFIDIKSNAAEKYSVNVTFDRTTGTENIVTNVITFYSISPMQVYVYTSHDVPASQTEKVWGYAFVVSDSKIDNVGVTSSEKYTKNGKDFYVMKYNLSFGPLDASSGHPNQYYDVYSDCGKDIRLKTQYATAYDFAQAYINDSLDVVIDYSSFEVDDDMPVPTNIKRNIIKNEIKDSLIPDTLGGETYDYITWTNTSETYPLQLQVVPVVQYFDVRLTENIFTKEFYGEWNTQAIYEEVTNSFTLCTFATNPDTLLKYPLFTSGLSFKSECNDKYSKGFFEENYLKFGYRIRYVDIENEKASPWLVLVPTKELDDYKTFVEYADTSISDSSDGNGLFNEYENLDDIENAKTDIKTENEFKDKYDVVDGDVDVQEATNWLYSVVNFIKGTPQVVGSVLGFLPQPILYGMYVCIFLGIIASGIAIVKALL